MARDASLERLATTVGGLALWLCLVATVLGTLAPGLSLHFRVRLVISMLYLMAGALWVLGMAIRGRVELQSTGLGMPALLFFVLIAASTATAVCVRPGLVQGLLWFSYAIGFLVVMHEADRPRLWTIFLVALVVCGVVIAWHGVYQLVVALPETREQFYRDPQASLEEAGIPPDTFQEFEGRLMANRAMGTFLLPNSLAGFLVLVIPVGVGLLVDQWRERRLALTRTHFLLGAVGLGAMAACLVLTKSKGGWLSFAAAMCVFVLRGEAWLWKRLGKPLLVAAAGAIICLLVAQRSGLVPPLGDYAGSFAVRVPYWRAAVQVAAERPLLGVGPGNFADAYTARKGAMDQETRLVHNDLLQVTAEMGCVAVVTYVLLWWRFWRRVWRPPAETGPGRPDDEPFHGWWWQATLSVWLMSFLVARAVWLLAGAGRGAWKQAWTGALALAWIAWALLSMRPAARFDLKPRSATMAGALGGLAGFLVHGLMDVDLFVEGIAQSVAMVGAVVLAAWQHVGPRRVWSRPVGPAARTAMAVGSVGLAFALWWGLGDRAAAAADQADRADALLHEARSLLRQVWVERQPVPRAEAATRAGLALEKIGEAVRALKHAAALDALDDTVFGALADACATLDREGRPLDPDDGMPNLTNAIRFAREACRLNPGHSSHFARLARLYLANWRRTGWPDMLQKAYEAMRKAVGLFPSYPVLHAEFAEISERMGFAGEALDHLREALRLDQAQYHHVRRRLSPELRERVARRTLTLEQALRSGPGVERRPR